MGRLLRSKVPTANKLLKPRIICKEAAEVMRHNKLQSKYYYDCNAKSRQSFTECDNILHQSPITKLWQRGKVVDVSKTPRTYKIKTKDYKTVIRNRIFITKSLNEPILYEPSLQTTYEPENILTTTARQSHT